MPSLRADIKALRCQVDGDSKYFVPHQDLFQLLTLDAIRSSLSVAKSISPERLQGLSQKIFVSARRVYAILVLGGNEQEIIRFIENDNLQNSPIDHRLPISREDLETLVPKISGEFYEKQWEFCAPIFIKETEHRILDMFTVLPFVKQEFIASGGFGIVYRLQLHPSHQDAAWMGFESRFPEKVGSDQSHEQELRNFTLLSHLKHPHIQQLLASFTHQKEHNFIFPLASTGDMEALFLKEIRPAELQSDLAIYMALANLCSGLEALHDFSASEKLDINIMGLHRDVKPSNILVNAGDFLLTDFGLSTFKSVTDTSKTPFRVGGGDFLPPECEDLQTFQKGLVGRSGDIWSLGCVILELLVYMRDGPSGVQRFRQERVVQATFMTRTFHGPGKEVNPNVLALMANIEESCTLSIRHLLHVIRDMLRITPSVRLNAKALTRKMRFIAIQEFLISVDLAFPDPLRISPVQAALELEKLGSWKHTLGFVDSAQQPATTCQEFHLDYSRTIELLQQYRSEGQRMLELYQVCGRTTFMQLRKLSDALFELLPGSNRDEAITHLDLRTLQNEALVSSAMTGNLSNELSPMSQLGTLAYAIKFSKEINMEYETLTLEQDDSLEGLKLDPQDVKIEKGTGEHTLGLLSHGGGEDTRNVLIEWIRYDLEWEGDVRTEMIRRVAKIANSLHQMSKHTGSFRTLNCSHYFHSTDEHAFGLVFDLPIIEDVSITSLHSLIKSTRKCYQRISLEDRLALAYSLASTVLAFHKATLVHKSISSNNIVFLKSTEFSLRNPYLVGFNYARPNQPKAFTTGPPPNRNAQHYYHPDYDSQNARSGQSFRITFDYYSLGLVLIEIGLWDVVANFNTKSQRDLQKKVLESRLPILTHTMGSAYHDAVEACLLGTFAADSSEGAPATVLDFQRFVVKALQTVQLPCWNTS
ncbi:uncharacterized protein N0V89_003634 [Didymosphaeria variabile]|uniref:Protein kinase domain-containing protein n=1 Tax=Didymosphaeria variabile TaxID=1932322 RepID=A0A9W9CBP4_9PLEO|nr:uncharacterized protein N0V89_003634 [Didymosphaeria variabile]KAJ4355614.1 hypothetical protein N0V89_003634 [Didymosphaeria variabile]